MAKCVVVFTEDQVQLLILGIRYEKEYRRVLPPESLKMSSSQSTVSFAALMFKNGNF